MSRNRTVGFGLGQGKTLDQVQKELGQVAEGVRNARSVHDLAARLQVDMPISATVYRMLYEGVPAKVAVTELLGRETKAELAQ
jgi:glycerol-3-phosphate dehydrogenase (NAD(P)+)